jgi:hypothetical protein
VRRVGGDIVEARVDEDAGEGSEKEQNDQNEGQVRQVAANTLKSRHCFLRFSGHRFAVDDQWM